MDKVPCLRASLAYTSFQVHTSVTASVPCRHWSSFVNCSVYNNPRSHVCTGLARQNMTITVSTVTHNTKLHVLLLSIHQLLVKTIQWHDLTLRQHCQGHSCSRQSTRVVTRPTIHRLNAHTIVTHSLPVQCGASRPLAPKTNAGKSWRGCLSLLLVS